ncbi:MULTISPECIES: hypothetical protein [unclassified Serratia (in: enterobacteria)]|uniref:hypothetical protein n=1 Tax=unclassified Serratia (in: enterobacteria) TaxID=2647522 RepID=UPI0005031225|nr:MULTISPECIES: hypothetical protein [unclassified Serratia (in: enterobacteria)]KFK94344.1 hypothetical protein JV45_10445 [Serratia sp. Ag2]KFK99531.1 hypothetical protein IV04_07255 [Serratia sp. Ag1]
MVNTRRDFFCKLIDIFFQKIESATVLCKLYGNLHAKLGYRFTSLRYQEKNDMQCITTCSEIDIRSLEKSPNQMLNPQPVKTSSISDPPHHIELTNERPWIYSNLFFQGCRIRSDYFLIVMLAATELRCTFFPVLEKMPLKHLNKI